MRALGNDPSWLHITSCIDGRQGVSSAQFLITLILL